MIPISSFEKIIWTWTVHFNSEVQNPRADLIVLGALEAKQGLFEGLQNRTPPPISSRNQLKRLFDEGRVSKNGIGIQANAKLKPGDRIQIEFPAPVPNHLIPENRPLEVLYEDEHLLVINKPQGLTVHPSSTQQEGTLVHALLHHIRDLSGIGGVLRPGIVHRIDKDTSGALVVAKTDLAQIRLTKHFSTHSIERVYWALCYSSPKCSEKRIESLFGRNPNDRKKMSMNVPRGKKAITYFRKAEEYGQPGKGPFASWLEITLETGRTHQIRVHLTGEGHSILGDPVYGTPTQNQSKWLALPEDVKKAISGLSGQALHARVLGFEHPITGKILRFEAAPSAAFSELWEICRRYSRSA